MKKKEFPKTKKLGNPTSSRGETTFSDWRHICINYRTWLLYSSIIDKMYVESRENPMPPTWFVPPFSRLISLTRGVFTMQSYAFRLYPASFTFCFLTTVHPNSAYFQAYGVYFQAYGVSPIVKQCNFVLSPLLSLYIRARVYAPPATHYRTSEAMRPLLPKMNTFSAKHIFQKMQNMHKTSLNCAKTIKYPAQKIA